MLRRCEEQCSKTSFMKEKNMNYSNSSLSDQRPLIKALLLDEKSETTFQEIGLSEIKVTAIRKYISSLPCKYVTDTTKILRDLSLEGGGPVFGTYERTSKVFSVEYSQLVLCLIVALWNARREIVALYDTQQGAIIQTRLAMNFWSWPMHLSFEVVDEVGSFARLTGATVVKRQLYDWGRGKNTLDDTIKNVNLLLAKLPHSNE